MSHIERGLTSAPRLESQDEIVRYLTKEIAPMVKALREEVNRTNGDLVSLTEAEDVTVDRKTRHVVYDAAGTATVTLPPARDVPEQTYTVYRTNSAGVVTVVAGTSSYVPSAGSAVEVVSDGTRYHVK